jgi:Flp pilus assembly protein TadD
MRKQTLRICSCLFATILYRHMGRTKAKTKKRARIEVQSAQDSSSAPSVPALYAKAQILVEQCDYELAAKFLRRILEKESTHVQAHELLGVVSLELGDLATAQTVSRLPVRASCH